MSKNKTNVYKIIFGILLILLIAVSVYSYSQKYLPKQKKETQIKEYKIELYKSILCEYSCPLSDQLYNNKTQLLPTLDCVKTCTLDFKTKWSNFNVTKEELITDSLLPNIGLAIKDCKTSSFDETKMNVNNSLFFSCSIASLERLKQNYSYIK